MFYNTHNSSESFRRYIKEISKYPLLSVEEERSLLDQIKNSNSSEKEKIDAKTKLVNSNLRLVVNLAKKYSSSSFLLEDLVSSGNIGLMRSVDKYDHTKGKTFASYASWFIKTEMIFTLLELSPSFKMSRKVSNLLNYLKSFEGLANTPEELAEISKIPLEKINAVLSYNFRHVSLNNPLNNESQGEDLIYYLADSSFSPETLSVKDQKEIFDLIYPFLKSEKEKQVFEIRYGLDGQGYKTLEEVSNYFDLTRERIRQIEGNILKRVKKSPKTMQKLELYLDKELKLN